MKATEWLASVKARPVVPLPKEPEELKALYERIDTAGHAAEMVQNAYFELSKTMLAVHCFPLHRVLRTRSWDTIRLVWLANGMSYGTKLTAEEIRSLAMTCRLLELLKRLEIPPDGNPHGPFSILDLLAGDSFADIRGEVFRVCADQGSEEWVEVWSKAESIHAKRVVADKRCKVWAVSEKDAARIRRRLARKKRR